MQHNAQPPIPPKQNINRAPGFSQHITRPLPIAPKPKIPKKRGNSVGNVASESGTPVLAPKPRLTRKLSDGNYYDATMFGTQPPVPPKPRVARKLSDGNYPTATTSSQPPIPPKPTPDLPVKNVEEEKTNSHFTSANSSPVATKSISVEYFIAEFDHPKGKEEELELSKGDVVCVLERTSEDWYYVTADAEACGFVASSFLSPFFGDPPAHLQSLALALLESDDESQNDDHYSQEEEYFSNSVKTQRNTSQPTFPSYGSRIQSTKLEHSGQLSSSISSKLKQGSKFLKRKRRRSIGSVRVPGSSSPSSFTIKRQSSSQSITEFAVGVDALPDAPVPNISPRAHSSTETVIPFIKRGKIAKEVLTTEKHYIEVLTTLLEDYKPTLLHGVGHYEGGITKENITGIFINTEALLPLAKRLAKELEDVLEVWDEESTIGDIFVRIAPFMKIYNEYGSRYNDAMTTLSICNRNEIFLQLVQGVDVTTKISARFESLLIAPIQRIPRYTLLLEELLRNTAEDHPDYPFLTRAIPMMEEVAGSINETVKKAENQLQILNLPFKGAQDLVKPHRILIHEGSLSDVRNKKINIILFNDILVPVPEGKSKKTNFQKDKYKWPLHLVWVEISMKQKNAFSLVGPNASYILVAEDFQVWMMRILAAITKHLEAITITRDPSLQDESKANMNIDNSRRFGSFSFSSQQHYKGWWTNGRFDGVGTLDFMNSKYEGSWRTHTRCGQGIMHFLSGDEYNGEWINDAQDGYGVMTYINGDVYKGNWSCGAKKGKGTLEYECGAIYTGDWLENLPDGYGEMSFADGASYKGLWTHGLRNGTGVYVFQNGDIYDGEWSNDVRTGKGKISYTDQTDYDGLWRDNLYHGHGILRSPQIAYEGDFVNGCKEGNGVMRYESGVEYKGSWKKDLYHGTGTITFKRGMIRSYMGDWQNGKRHGSGILQMFSDDVFDGHFRDNLMHGSGTYTWKNGTAFKAKWTKGTVSPNTECTLIVATKANPAKKKQFSGSLLDGRLVSSTHPPLHVPHIPSLDLLQ